MEKKVVILILSLDRCRWAALLYCRYYGRSAIATKLDCPIHLHGTDTCSSFWQKQLRRRRKLNFCIQELSTSFTTLTAVNQALLPQPKCPSSHFSLHVVHHGLSCADPSMALFTLPHTELTPICLQEVARMNLPDFVLPVPQHFLFDSSQYSTIGTSTLGSGHQSLVHHPNPSMLICNLIFQLPKPTQWPHPPPRCTLRCTHSGHTSVIWAELLSS